MGRACSPHLLYPKGGESVKRTARIWLALSGVLLVVLSTAGLAVAATSKQAWFDRLETVYEAVSKRHYKGVDLDTFMEGAIKGGLATLNDPYTDYFSAQDWSDFLGSLDGDFSGIGAYMDDDPNYVVIKSPIKGSPAEKAGLRAGDRVLKVDGVSMAGMPSEKAVTLIRGKAGTQVTLEIERPSENRIFTVTITRALISLPDLDYKMLDGGIGYLALYNFGSDTDTQFWKAVADLKQQGAKALVLDLRDNGGGYVEVAISIAGGWVPKGEPVLTTVEKSRRTIERSPGGLIELPTAVLVNGGTASASEILSGAIQDWKAGTLVGTQTFGKGTVQQLLSLESGEGLKVTIAEYLTAKGRHVDKVGLKPDVEVKPLEVSEQVLQPLDLGAQALVPNQTGLNVLRLQEKLQYLGYQGETTGWFGHLTERAVLAFKRAEGLKAVSGMVDKSTVDHLNAAVLAKAKQEASADRQLETAVNLLKAEIAK